MSDSLIEISGLKKSCGCLKTTLEKNELAPGESMELEVTLESPGSGKKSFTIQVLAAIAQREFPVSVRLHAESAAPLVVPAEVDFGTLMTDDLPISRAIQLSRGTHPFVWQNLSCVVDDEGLKAKVSEFGENRWKLDLSLNEERVIGPYGAVVSLTTRGLDGESIYVTQLPVVAQFVGPARASPQSVLVGGLRLGQEYSSTVQIVKQSTAESLSIKGITSDHPRFVRVPEIGATNGNSLELVFCAIENWPEPLSGKIRIAVDIDRVEYVIQVPYLMKILPEELPEPGKETIPSAEPNKRIVKK